jgi:TrmH family RNA methyltransferase
VTAIRSARNVRVQRVRVLRRSAERAEQGLFTVEGEDLVGAAIRHGVALEDLLVREGADVPSGYDGPVAVVDGDVLDAVSSLGSGTRLIGVARIDGLPAAPTTLRGVGLLLCGVGDPGNVGTLLRSAAAFDAEVVVLGPPAADPTSPKGVRAAMGATFSVPTLRVADAAAACPETRVVALDGLGETDIADVDLTGPVLLALGAEREGLPDTVRARAEVVCRIPQSDRAESLNVAAAGAIALAMAYRLRGHG